MTLYSHHRRCQIPRRRWRTPHAGSGCRQRSEARGDRPRDGTRARRSFRGSSDPGVSGRGRERDHLKITLSTSITSDMRVPRHWGGVEGRRRDDSDNQWLLPER